MNVSPERIAEVIGAELDEGDFNWWWLSFADGDLPKGEQFLGVALVRAHGMGTAAMTAHTLGINPGGEAMGIEIPPTFDIPAEYQNRLLTKDECAALDEILARQKN